MATTESTEVTEEERDLLTSTVIGCAIEVHRHLGPGLLESAYQQCLAHELMLAGIAFRVQMPMPVEYKGVHLECGYRIDFLIDNRPVVEIKTVEQLLAVHQAQILTYMKLARIPVGLLINFNTQLLKNAIRRFAI